jgi:hypothetical protein
MSPTEDPIGLIHTSRGDRAARTARPASRGVSADGPLTSVTRPGNAKEELRRAPAQLAGALRRPAAAVVRAVTSCAAGGRHPTASSPAGRLARLAAPASARPASSGCEFGKRCAGLRRPRWSVSEAGGLPGERHGDALVGRGPWAGGVDQRYPGRFVRSGQERVAVPNAATSVRRRSARDRCGPVRRVHPEVRRPVSRTFGGGSLAGASVRSGSCRRRRGGARLPGAPVGGVAPVAVSG